VAVQVAQLALAVGNSCGAAPAPIQGGLRDLQSLVMTLTDHVEVHELLLDAGDQIGAPDNGPLFGCALECRFGLVQLHPSEQNGGQAREGPAHRSSRDRVAVEGSDRLSAQPFSLVPSALAPDAPGQRDLRKGDGSCVGGTAASRRLQPLATQWLGLRIATQLTEPLDELVSPGRGGLGTSTVPTGPPDDQLLQDGDCLVHSLASEKHLVELLADGSSKVGRAGLPRAVQRLPQHWLGTLGIERDHATSPLPEQLLGPPPAPKAGRQPHHGHAGKLLMDCAVKARSTLTFGLGKMGRLI